MPVSQAKLSSRPWGISPSVEATVSAGPSSKPAAHQSERAIALRRIHPRSCPVPVIVCPAWSAICSGWTSSARIHGAAIGAPSSRSTSVELWSAPIAAHFRLAAASSDRLAGGGIPDDTGATEWTVCPRSCGSSTRDPISALPVSEGRKRPLRRGFRERRTTDFDFCRFCHFRVLTAKMVSHITRLADADGLAARRQRFSDRADMLPGNRRQNPVPKN